MIRRLSNSVTKFDAGLPCSSVGKWTSTSEHPHTHTVEEKKWDKKQQLHQRHEQNKATIVQDVDTLGPSAELGFIAFSSSMCLFIYYIIITIMFRVTKFIEKVLEAPRSLLRSKNSYNNQEKRSIYPPFKFINTSATLNTPTSNFWKTWIKHLYMLHWYSSKTCYVVSQIKRQPIMLEQ
jgi:hypothetical protein